MPRSLLRVDPHGPYAEELAHVKARLNPKERVFLAEYLTHMDVERACKAINLSPFQGQKMLGRHYVKRAVELALADLEDRRAVTKDNIVKEMAKLAFANMGDYVETTPEGDPFLDYGNLSRDQTAAISKMTIEDYVDGRGPDAREVKRVRFELHDKLASLNALARHLGMFVDRVDVKTEMSLRLANMNREERLQLMHELLMPMQKLLPPGETVDVDPEEEIEDEPGS